MAMSLQARRLVLLNLHKVTMLRTEFSASEILDIRTKVIQYHSAAQKLCLTGNSSYERRLFGLSAVRCSTTSCRIASIGVSTRNSEKKWRGAKVVETTAVSPIPHGNRNEDFLADENVSWQSLKLSPELCEALMRTKFMRPSLVQASSIPTILSGRDVIVAAETGSGKTHAYLAPIFHLMLRKRKEYDEAQAKDEERRIPRGFALILCPNATLCQQVVDMANMLQSDQGVAMLDAVAICGGQGWPIKPPDIVIATPAAVLNHLFAYDPRRRRRKAFIRDACCVVFDEADMLLSGGFARDFDHLIQLLRLEERQVAKLWQFGPLKPERGTEPWTDFKALPDAVDDEDFSGGEEENLENEDEESISAVDEPEVGSASSEMGDQEGSVISRSYWQSKKLFKRSKQYIFVAATLPENGKRTPGALLKRMFPEAQWVNGSFLHCHSPRIQHKWMEVSDETRIKALLGAVSEGGKSGGEGGAIMRTMVFANSVDAVNAISRIFTKAEIPSFSYHRDIPMEERIEILRRFQHEGGLLLCTDAAARGIDVPNIGHVVQAEFASSVVDFLHRVGRTGRAGQSGMVTNLFTEANRPLVEAVQNALTNKQSVDGAFSRKRSFRNKLKKYGKERRGTPREATQSK